MTTSLVPKTTQVAAKRGFIRTTTQALSVTIPTAGITGAALSSSDPSTIGWAVLAGLISSLGAGAASYFSIISKGIPEEYQDKTDVPVS